MSFWTVLYSVGVFSHPVQPPDLDFVSKPIITIEGKMMPMPLYAARGDFEKAKSDFLGFMDRAFDEAWVGFEKKWKCFHKDADVLPHLVGVSDKGAFVEIQSENEQITVILKDGDWIKYDDNGNVVSVYTPKTK